MPQATIIRADLVKAVSQDIGLPHDVSAKLLSAMLNHMTEALIKEEAVKLSGFGTFYKRYKHERPGRNPNTGEKIPVAARHVVVFKPSEKLKTRVQMGCSK